MNNKTFAYSGKELELFAHAVVWKRYWKRNVAQYIGASVLEVGAGRGSNTILLRTPDQHRWICIEPDIELASSIQEAAEIGRISLPCEIRTKTLQDEPPPGRIDTILYLDSLEHIEDDRLELELAARALDPGGHCIVLAPAFNRLYSRFDAEIGHFRRYDRALLRSIAPTSLSEVRIRYLDSVGMAASAWARYFARSPYPAPWQIALWDRALVRVSIVFDRITGFRFGKSILAIWRKRKTAEVATT